MIDFLLSIEEHKEEYDSRQAWKIRYPLSTILFLVFSCQLAGIETWKEMEDFIEMNESVLGEYVDLSVGCPSHDTLERVVSMVNPDFIKELKLSFEASSETTDFSKLIAVDGKTIRGNRGKHQSPTHIVTAYDGGNRISLGQVAVEDKSNEITAVPRLLRQLDLRKSVVTLDIDLYFSDAKLLSKLTEKGCHYQTIEKARSQLEVRDYWVSHDVRWLSQRHPKWKKLRGIGMTKNTIDKDGVITEEVRYFILSFKGDVQTFSQVVRGHWSVESLHWLLDVVYREDKNQTLDKRAAFNLNAIRKVCLYLLQTMTFPKEKLSYRRKQRYISVHLEHYLPQLFGNRG